MTKIYRIAAAALLAFAPAAQAKPPSDAKPIYKPYFEQLHVLGEHDNPHWCCTLDVDCRPVDERVNPETGKWEALIDKETFDNDASGAPDEPTWYEIPDATWVAPAPEEMPRPYRGVVCFYNAQICCADKPLPGG